MIGWIARRLSDRLTETLKPDIERQVEAARAAAFVEGYMAGCQNHARLLVDPVDNALAVLEIALKPDWTIVRMLQGFTVVSSELRHIKAILDGTIQSPPKPIREEAVR